MSASEVLQQVKTLPLRERRKFFASIYDLEVEMETASPPRGSKRVRWPDATARRRRIFGKNVLPNLVLLAREMEPY